MSARLMGLIFEVGPRNRYQRFVLLAIANRINKDGFAWPSISLIAEETCFSIRHVKAALSALEAEAWLVRERRGNQGTNYRVNSHKLEAAKVLKDTRKTVPSSFSPTSKRDHTPNGSSAKTAPGPIISGATTARATIAPPVQNCTSEVQFTTVSGAIWRKPPTPPNRKNPYEPAFNPQCGAAQQTPSAEAIEQIILAHPWTDYRRLLARRSKILANQEIVQAVAGAICREAASRLDLASAVVFIQERTQELRCLINSTVWREHCSTRRIAQFFGKSEYTMEAWQLQNYWQKTKRRPNRKRASPNAKVVEMTGHATLGKASG